MTKPAALHRDVREYLSDISGFTQQAIIPYIAKIQKHTESLTTQKFSGRAVDD